MPQHEDLDVLVPLIFFPGRGPADRKTAPSRECHHLGTLVKDGFNLQEGRKMQRVKCSACQKRFGNDPSAHNLLTYQTHLKQVIYELFIARNQESEMATRWLIPQPKLAQFKKAYVTRVLADHPQLFRSSQGKLPRGILLADETFAGRMGNSNTEIQMINADFQALAAGPAAEGDLANGIQEVFRQIPASTRAKLKVLITDGEPSYGTLALQSGGRVVHVQQLHLKRLLGQVKINKYVKFGPHHLHYIIHTHWRAFKQESALLHFRWEVKFIKGLLYRGSGRVPKDLEQTPRYHQWRRKRDEYYSRSFQKKGEAEVFVNRETGKLTPRAGATRWMVSMLAPVAKIFLGKCITTNWMESKNSQVKRKGASRKQQDTNYSDALFKVCAYLAEHGHLPRVSLEGRPLFKYIVGDRGRSKEGYLFHNDGVTSRQLLLSAYYK
jgi:hypothetical protein